MISYHPYGGDNPTAGYKTADTNDVQRLCAGITRFVWSGIIWKEGYRCTSNFLLSDWCVLDFDDPEMTLAEALKIFCDCIHIIGTTRNHQKPKHDGIVCDRFRVAIPWENRITNVDEYCFNMKRLVDAYPVDKKCKDGARFFFPCVEIVSSSDEGYKQEVKPKPPEPPKKTLEIGEIPVWAYVRLDKRIPEGERNNTVFCIAKDLLRSGLSVDEVTKLVLLSPTFKSIQESKDARDARSTIRSAWKSLNRER